MAEGITLLHRPPSLTSNHFPTQIVIYIYIYIYIYVCVCVCVSMCMYVCVFCWTVGRKSDKLTN